MSAIHRSPASDPTPADPACSRPADVYFLEVYKHLRALAGSYLRRERAAHTLQPTALVNEAYLRLRDAAADDLPDRAKFMALAARAMRQVLIDSARRHQADKRQRQEVTFEEEILGAEPQNVDVLALDDALEELARLDGQRARIVELRFFAGLSCDEVAEALGVSSRTVVRQWRSSRAFLLQRIL
jgi:RNA polymerase sigma factor (TIGR02999 family)